VGVHFEFSNALRAREVCPRTILTGQRQVWLSYELEAPASESVTSINTHSRVVLVLIGEMVQTWRSPAKNQLSKTANVSPGTIPLHYTAALSAAQPHPKTLSPTRCVIATFIG
jgi:hypothetical protein